MTAMTYTRAKGQGQRSLSSTVRVGTDGETNDVDLTGLLGDIKEDWGARGRKSPSGVQRRSPGRRSGGRSLPEADAFCETTHNICIKIQQTTVAVTRVDILNDITSKRLGGTLPWMSPFINIGVTCPPCSIGIDAPGRDGRDCITSCANAVGTKYIRH